MKTAVTFLCLLLPLLTFSQNNSDTLTDFLDKECDGGKLFTIAEHNPTVKEGIDKLTDSLFAFFQKSGMVISPKKLHCFLLVTKNSQVVKVEYPQKYPLLTPEENTVISEGLIKYGYMWNCAMQNGYKVCGFARLEIDFTGAKLKLRYLPIH
ncbi:MAG: hypothetical protein U0V75_10765 [Ferruginibacter sp.]